MPMRILIVEDSAAMRALLSKHVRELGLTDIDEAEDGEAALALTLTRHYDLILLDWVLPKKTGLDVLKLVRARGNTVPVVMVTAESERGRVLEAIRAGVNDYIFKPFSAETVREKLRRLLSAAAV